MARNRLVQVQIGLLLGIAFLVISRAVKGPPGAHGVIVFEDLKDRELEHAFFEVDDAARVVIRATGSFDERPGAEGLAAQAWIIRCSDHTVVWRMDPSNVERGRGTLASIQGDTLILEAGLYEAYFSSYGQVAARGQRPWRSDRDHWLFVLDGEDEDAAVRQVWERQHPVTSGSLLWQAAPLENNEQREHIFEVSRPTTIGTYAVGQITNDPVNSLRDYSRIEDAVSGAAVWGLSRDNTEPAGGLPDNRIYSGAVALQPGVYRALVSTDRTHAYGDWRGNPPYDPEAWGITLRSEDPDAIRAFDPWLSRTPLISFTQVGNDADLIQRFQVSERISVVAYAIGEITSSGATYDYAQLFEELPGRRRAVWSMSWDASVHAGGGRKNRVEVAFLTLDPGTYMFRYESDGSHAAGSWNVDMPDYPERWGVSLFPVSAESQEGVFTLLENLALKEKEARDLEASVIDVDWTRLEGGVAESFSFRLGERGLLHISATGEFIQSKAYDYGWISSVSGGEKVWEMTYANTEAAGGSANNRRFDDTVELPAGEYTINFKTDDSHHYDDFGGSPPDRPEDWGIRVHYAGRNGNDR